MDSKVFYFTSGDCSTVTSTDKAKESVLGTSQLIDRIKGVIYGNCIGDAVGLLTEFMDKEEAARVILIDTSVDVLQAIVNTLYFLHTY